jgi:hypothetical protein
LLHRTSNAVLKAALSLTAKAQPRPTDRKTCKVIFG